MRAIKIGSYLVAGAVSLAACSSGSGDHAGPGGNPTPVSYVGTTGNFVAWADPASNTYASATVGSYAGKRQVLRGTIDFLTGAQLGQAAGVEIYKANDGHIYALDLTSTSQPNPVQISSEGGATIDDGCSLSGTAVVGANLDYVGVSFTADLVTPTRSAYFYRLPGPDGVCNTSDDLIRMVRTGMSATDAPIVVSAMPIVAVRTAQGGIAGFVIKDGASLVLLDDNFANPVTLGTMAAPIGVAQALAVGTTQGYPTGQLFDVDGNIVYVNYAARTISDPLFTIPDWQPTAAHAVFAASPTTQYFSIYTAATVAGTAASSAIYAMPADGSTAPTLVDTEAGRVTQLVYPVNGSALLMGMDNGVYSIAMLAPGDPASTMLVTSTGNGGQFIATATAVYYESWTQSSDPTTKTVSRSATMSGIVGLSGTVIQAPLANSTFVNGGEQLPWPSDTTTTQTAYATVFQAQGLSPVTVVDATTGWTYVADGVSAATLVGIDTSSNQPVATIGVLPVSNATFLSGTFRGAAQTGFLEATTWLSNADPATRDLYLLDSHTAGSLTRVTKSL